MFEPAFPKQDGTVAGLPVNEPVQVLRDGNGIAHIYAKNEKDLLTAQGFVQAQDRLFEMELLRRLTSGTLAEIVGEDALSSDYFIHLSGFNNLKRRAAANLSAEDRELVQAFVNGINAFLADDSHPLPGEFTLLGMRPAPWTVEDAFGVLSAVCWFFQTNFIQEIFALETRGKLDRAGFDMLYPSHPGAVLPDDAYFEQMRSLNIAPFQPEVLAFFNSFFTTATKGGSNNWAVKNGPGGKPMLANDTHMTILNPNLWYISHLDSPTLSAAGMSIPGSPGILIGHNGKIAWGFTNLLLDGQDLFVVETDPADPARYRVGKDWLRMEEKTISIALPGGKVKVYKTYTTKFGPVISSPAPGSNAAVALKWYGTVDDDAVRDRSTHSFFALGRAGNVAEAVDAARGFVYVGQNMIVTDTAGNMAYHALGTAPVRSGYSGRLPAFGSSGDQDWTGFAPYETMPSELNPPNGVLATANNRVTTDASPNALSYMWGEPYRVDRIKSLLSKTQDYTPEYFTKMQGDVRSALADSVLDRLLKIPMHDPLASEALRILSAWDHESDTQSLGALVFEVFVVEWVYGLAGDELGDDIGLYFAGWNSTWTVEDVILDHPESALWDDIRTPQKETEAQIVEDALKSAMTFIESRLGKDRSKWSWGALHTVRFDHVAGGIGILSGLLNRGPYPRAGNQSSLNIASFLPGDRDYRVIGIPNMRFIVPLGDPDKALVVSPPGQSGIASNPHYDDMIEPWLAVRNLPLPFSAGAVRKAAKHSLMLVP